MHHFSTEIKVKWIHFLGKKGSKGCFTNFYGIHARQTFSLLNENGEVIIETSDYIELLAGVPLKSVVCYPTRQERKQKIIFPIQKSYIQRKLAVFLCHYVRIKGGNL